MYTTREDIPVNWQRRKSIPDMPMPLIKIILFALFAINTLRMAWTGWPLPFPLLLPHFSALPWNWCFVAQMDNWIPLRSTCLKDQRPKGFCTRKISEKYGKAKYYLLLSISSSSGWMSKFGPRDHWREAAASSNLPDGHHLGIWWWSSWYLVIITLVFGDHHLGIWWSSSKGGLSNDILSPLEASQ